MARLKPFFQRFPHLLRQVAYVGTVGLFLWICAQFYVPGKGFTYLERFGSRQSERYLPALRPDAGPNAINHYEEEGTDGYDAQYYAQIAMRPWLSNPALKRAMDSLPYRARRILFSWTAYGLGLGDPARALHIYAVQNILCWLALAGLMLRWFPPVTWGNFVRWFAVLFSSGLCLSVRGSLVDGPSLLLIAGGVALAEAGRPWWSAALLGVAGLGKETNILAAATLPIPPRAAGLRAWSAAIARVVLVLLPIALWMTCLWFWLGRGNDVGMRNFAWPFYAYFNKWDDTLQQLQTEGVGSVAQWSLLTLIAMSAQWGFFLLRPRWRDPWWRVGAAYAVLMAGLGDAVWEGYPGAASRVLLPMTLAFNILVPRGRNVGWWLVLLLGNLTVIFSSDFLKPPGRDDYHLHGPHELIMIEKSGQTIEARFSEKEWYLPERSRFDYWRWSRGNAEVILHNPLSFAVSADIAFDLKSNDERQVTVRSGEQVLWSGATTRTLHRVSLPGIRLEPGSTTWTIESNQPARKPLNDDLREMAFSLRNLNITVLRRVEPSPKPAEKP